MTDFVDPNVINEINIAKEELISEVSKVKPCVEKICDFSETLGDSVEEAPDDGKLYGRQSKNWVEVEAEVLSDSEIKSKYESNADKVKLDSLSTSGGVTSVNGETGAVTLNASDVGAIEDAPSDSKQYARKNGAWEEVASSGGSGGTQGIDKTADLVRIDTPADGQYGTVRPTSSQWNSMRNKRVLWKGAGDNGYVIANALRMELSAMITAGYQVGDEIELLIPFNEFSDSASDISKINFIFSSPTSGVSNNIEYTAAKLQDLKASGFQSGAAQSALFKVRVCKNGSTNFLAIEVGLG